MLLARLHIAVVVVGGVGVMSGAASEPTTSSAPAIEGRQALEAQLAGSERTLADRRPSLEKRLAAIPTELKDLEARRGSLSADELTKRKERLVSERAALQRELSQLESSKAAWQAALDACENAQGLRQQHQQFREGRERKKATFVPADVEAFTSQLSKVLSDRVALEKGQTARGQRLASLTDQIDKADDQAKPSLEAERSALLAEAAADRHKGASFDAEQALLEAKLAAAGEVLGKSATTGPTTTSTAPAPVTEQEDADNKKRLAADLAAKARDHLSDVRDRLQQIEAGLKRATAAGRDTTDLENDREYWQRVEGYEKRRLDEAKLQERAGKEKQGLAQLAERVEATKKNLEQLRATRREESEEKRRQQAARLRTQADDARVRANDLEERSNAEAGKIQPLQQSLGNFDKIQQALRERIERADRADYERLFAHFLRMKDQLDAERKQIDVTIMMTENIVFAIKRQATLERELAGLYTRCADILVPPVPSFWERNVKVVNSVKMAVLVVGLSYGIKLIVWLIQLVVGYVSRAVPSGRSRFSVKRIGTLVSFTGSIVKLFVWIFGAIAVLNEFGINPATSSGAIGLIGLIMAGMFREIVVDFVKGLDIIAGGHYNVGDFVEVDGKLGHVVDFNVKHTQIRTISGQVLNVPNSRCIPSRRFPDGYVNNYVDIVLKSSADERRARAVIDPLCAGLNHRIEAIRDTPALALCFDDPKGGVIMRYRVRVLPGCGWVLTDYFLPAVKEGLAEAGIELAGEPTFFFINRLDTFRKLFSRQLSEEEIVRQLDEDEKLRRFRQDRLGPTTDEAAARLVSPDTDDGGPRPNDRA